ncbi:4Fe-4S binding protein [Desulfovibrio sp.]|uniref:GltB/FmdC/FwdC-like GXGXG domain-containing protein n=1 Tax=Desulfovibrio sp. TaxID=885 RepID=UPI0023D3FB91|nr:4Fe-4S binding protein [Desulfovibrio sp.]MDE7241506.1 4Fe-4S binding protein [Desulfovibrio sp.]
MLFISTVNGHERMSTRDLLLRIKSAVEAGETDFRIEASGQHDIGGPLWNAQGRTLHFEVSNPGQRVGSMALPGTEIVVRGPAPADVGWLNSGGRITVLGDCGDTTGHCAAAGVIHVAGRAGTRTGSLMKHDPRREPPELWVLGTVSSFAFEFMGGGRAVVCGVDAGGGGGEHPAPSVPLGERPCVGMVGGVVYVRGAVPELPPGVRGLPLDDADLAWLAPGLASFLAAVERPELMKALSRWRDWRKIVPDMHGGDGDGAPGGRDGAMRRFRAHSWPEGGLFGDVLPDSGRVTDLVASGDGRLRAPVWDAEAGPCRECLACVRACPQAALRRRGATGGGAPCVFSVEPARCIGCGICVAVCPQGLWRLVPVPEGAPL